MLNRAYLLLGMKGLSGLLGLIVLLQAIQFLKAPNPLQDARIPEPIRSASANNDNNQGPKPPPEDSNELKACLNHLERSGILGRTPGPQPLVLVGFAGSSAILQLPNGQTVLLAEGEERDGVKVIKTDTNRVLVEQDGQERELTQFSGIGSESLKK